MSQSPDAVMLGQVEAASDAGEASAVSALTWPLLARRPAAQQHMLLVLLVMLALIGVIGATSLTWQAWREAQDLDKSLLQLQANTHRTSKAATNVLLGLPNAGDELREAAQNFNQHVQRLRQSHGQRLEALMSPAVGTPPGLWERAAQFDAAVTTLAGAQGQAPQAGPALLEQPSSSLLSGLSEVQQRAQQEPVLKPGWLLVGLAGFGMLALGLTGLFRLFVLEQTRKAREADLLRQKAEHQEREAKRLNEANQAAILRLMNELQAVSEGDLTQQATVTEDITGAIADAVNYTVEELRTLVSQVQHVVQRMTRTTQQVEHTSLELLAGTAEQLREIRQTGDAVLVMSASILEISQLAQTSAEVARQTLKAADSGRLAAQNAISGMNAIRDQIQETAKRIKRLGESSQEIGEITDLISGITDQTHVLALNAAIQAASGGEAGRGFSLVAEEVQRLAERSGEASRQIAALVLAIQTDTQDAVAAMERSTHGVVEGARLTDAAGQALQDMERVTRDWATLTERISAQTYRDAQSAKVVAANTQHIFAVTEQTSEGTKSTSQVVRELSHTAEELRASVSRFKVQ